MKDTNKSLTFYDYLLVLYSCFFVIMFIIFIFMFSVGD